jgi:hypothetical protein
VDRSQARSGSNIAPTYTQLTYIAEKSTLGTTALPWSEKRGKNFHCSKLLTKLLIDQAHA